MLSSLVEHVMISNHMLVIDCVGHIDTLFGIIRMLVSNDHLINVSLLAKSKSDLHELIIAVERDVVWMVDVSETIVVPLSKNYQGVEILLLVTV